MFVQRLETDGFLPATNSLKVTLFGSLGATGKGHGSDKAVVAGLYGYAPETADPDDLAKLLDQTAQQNSLALLGKHDIVFDLKTDLEFHGKVLDFHSNALRISALDENKNVLLEKTYYSVGGGFVVHHDSVGNVQITEECVEVPYPFSTGAQLLNLCQETGFSISHLILQNELAIRTKEEIQKGLLQIWQVMKDCVNRGCQQEGILPGGLKVRRRAAPLFRKLQSETEESSISLGGMDWVDLWALAVNEENAAGGRVVTAPTNGAAGIIPAVLPYYHKYCPGANDEATIRFFLTSAAIGTLFKQNASISGAEVGCQGEVGSACSMAAAGLTEVLGGTAEQVENAAEIGMEHNLGLTCDPIGGLVQVPCIERNAMAAVKAINAARLALRGDGSHFVSLDKVIKTMRDTGRDMKEKYKETARGGLAVNVTEC